MIWKIYDHRRIYRIARADHWRIADIKVGNLDHKSKLILSSWNIWRIRNFVLEYRQKKRVRLSLLQLKKIENHCDVRRKQMLRKREHQRLDRTKDLSKHENNRKTFSTTNANDNGTRDGTIKKKRYLCVCVCVDIAQNLQFMVSFVCLDN